MKVKRIILGAVVLLSAVTLFMSFKNSEKEVKFLQITTIESVVPGGLGRSRMITASASGALEEIKMENFFSMAGINFENIRFNDKAITDKVQSLTNDGWELVQVTPGVYAAEKNGIFITRYLFKK
jgi:hypothetical protein